MALAASVLTCLALAAMAGGADSQAEGGQITTAAFAAEDRGAPANRSYDRQVVTENPADPTLSMLAPEVAKAKEDARKAAEAAEVQRAAEAKAAAEAQKAAEAAAAAAAANPPLVAGLNQTQMSNAKRIIDAGRAMGLPKRALVIAVATSMQECNLYNLASTRLLESYSYPNEGAGSDHDSIGLFQQRPSSGWGSIASIMDPTYAATAFYKVLVTVPGWDSMPLTYAAQRVQVSAFPEAYAKHEGRAQAVVDWLVP